MEYRLTAIGSITTHSPKYGKVKSPYSGERARHNRSYKVIPTNGKYRNLGLHTAHVRHQGEIVISDDQLDRAVSVAISRSPTAQRRIAALSAGEQVDGYLEVSGRTIEAYTSKLRLPDKIQFPRRCIAMAMHPGEAWWCVAVYYSPNAC
jgi:hypothetical protein